MKKFYTSLASLLIVASAVVSLNFMGTSTSAAGGRDCDANAIINCGALTASELKQKYAANKTGDIDNIFSHYGVSSSMVNGTSKMGTVGKDGKVIVDGKVVATSAQSIGRQNISGSSAVNIDGKTYYQRPTSVSFNSETIPAVVYFDSKGQYVAAVITSCGNPVKATPVVVTPPKPAPAPAAECVSIKANRITRDRYSFDATASTSNGATISGYVFQLRENNAQGRLIHTVTVNSTAKTAKSGETTQTPGTYYASVTVKTSLGDKTSARCATTFTIEKPEEKPAPCPVPGKEHLPKNSPDCVEPQVLGTTTPPATPAPTVEIPKTGPAEFLGGGLALGSLTGAAYYWRASRRNLVNSFLNR